MKTGTYLRFSLLLPFLIWGITLLIRMALDSLGQFAPGFPENVSLGFMIFFVGYVIGIIFWIFPYILLALILFFSTFISKARTAMLVFALSPIAMSVLTAATVGIMQQFTGVQDSGNIANLLLLSTGLVLGWGYLCVGIGYGIYRFLQHQGTIQDEEIITPSPQPV